MIFTQITVVIGFVVLAFIVYTVVLQQAIQDIVKELLNQEKIVRTNMKGEQEDT
ncbi:TPA: hypothetical protein ACQUHP_006252 [Bacillus cereus]